MPPERQNFARFSHAFIGSVSTQGSTITRQARPLYFSTTLVHLALGQRGSVDVGEITLVLEEPVGGVHVNPLDLPGRLGDALGEATRGLEAWPDALDRIEHGHVGHLATAVKHGAAARDGQIEPAQLLVAQAVKGVVAGDAVDTADDQSVASAPDHRLGDVDNRTRIALGAVDLHVIGCLALVVVGGRSVRRRC